MKYDRALSTPPILVKCTKVCHGNHAFFTWPKPICFGDKNVLHLGDPNEYYGTHKKNCPGCCTVGQISSRGNLFTMEKLSLIWYTYRFAQNTIHDS